MGSAGYWAEALLATLHQTGNPLGTRHQTADLVGIDWIPDRVSTRYGTPDRKSCDYCTLDIGSTIRKILLFNVSVRVCILI